MGILEKLAPDKIDPRIPWWLIFLVVLITYTIPLGLPVRINDYTLKAYNYIDKLPSGSIVLYSIDMSAAAYPEEEPARSDHFEAPDATRRKSDANWSY